MQVGVLSVLTQGLQVHVIFNGTSNVYLAKKLGLPPIGMVAHGYLQTF